MNKHFAEFLHYLKIPIYAIYSINIVFSDRIILKEKFICALTCNYTRHDAWRASYALKSRFHKFLLCYILYQHVRASYTNINSYMCNDHRTQ